MKNREFLPQIIENLGDGYYVVDGNRVQLYEFTVGEHCMHSGQDHPGAAFCKFCGESMGTVGDACHFERESIGDALA